MALTARTLERPHVRVVVAGHRVAVIGVLRDPALRGWFAELFDNVHEEAMAQRLREVTLDVTRLEAASAAIWEVLVVWVRRIRAARPEGYRLRVRANPLHRWQAVGMPTLAIFGADRIEIENITGGG